MEPTKSGPLIIDQEAPAEAREKFRLHSLDALRGLAIFGMALSGMIAFNILPAWMYHAQVPPPDHKFNPALPGITWVDLVFPFFLFAMGAAIPMAIDSRLRKGDSKLKIAGGLLWRGLLLAGFAIYLQNTRPPLGNTTSVEWGTSLAAMALLIPIFQRWPDKWPSWLQIGLRILGLAGVVAFGWFFRDRSGAHFNFEKNDIILLVLANVAFFGGLIYLFLDKKLRLAFCAVWLMAVIARTEPGWVKDLFAMKEAVKWVYNAEFLKYLLIVVPATFVGEAILEAREKFREGPSQDSAPFQPWPAARLLAIALLGVAAAVFVTIGLFARETGWVVLGSAAAGGLYVLACRWPADPRDELLRKLAAWGMLLLLMGLAAEPFQGGIKKDSATISYFLVTGGLSTLLLASLIVLIDRWDHRWLGLFVANGQNPILAYIGITHLMPWIWKGLGIEAWFVASFGVDPWAGFFRGLSEATLLLVIVAILTRLRVSWRA